jgi:hypothetical protein
MLFMSNRLEINVSIDTLRLNLHDSKHDTLYRVLGSTMVTQIKKRICMAIEDQIYGIIRRLDTTITQATQGSKGQG